MYGPVARAPQPFHSLLNTLNTLNTLDKLDKLNTLQYAPIMRYLWIRSLL